MTDTISIAEIKRRFEGIEIDAEKIKHRFEILTSMGYSDFTWFHNPTRQSCKEFKDDKYQGNGWIKYSCTCKNLHLISDEDFKKEIELLPEKEKIAKEKLADFIENAKAEILSEKIKNENEIQWQIDDRLKIANMISVIESLLNTSELNSQKFKTPFVKLIAELNQLKSL